MKKNANILEYMKKYKEKYAIHYAEEGSKLVKRLSILVSIVWCYSFFWMALSTLSFSLNFKMNVLDFSTYKKVFLITSVCTVFMIAASVLFICKQKIIGLSLAIIAQPLIIYAYKPISVYGMGYRARFYFAYSVPAWIMMIVCGILLFILVRAIYKTNQIYNYIVEELYKQHGTKNGEKLSDEEWQEFLTNYDPYNKGVNKKQSATNDMNVGKDTKLSDKKYKNIFYAIIRLEWADKVRSCLAGIPIIGKILSIIFAVVTVLLCLAITLSLIIVFFALLIKIHLFLAIGVGIVAINVTAFFASYVWKMRPEYFFWASLFVSIFVLTFILYSIL